MIESQPIPKEIINPGPAPEAQERAAAYIEGNILSKAEQHDSEVRARHFRQELADFELTSTFVDEHGERLPPSEKDITELNDRLDKLGALFADSGLHWQLDGAVNISLYAGQVIGRHKDIDISVQPDELAQLESHLARHGYGFFISEGWNKAQGDKTITFQRVNAKQFHDTSLHRMIIAIDEQGQVRHDAGLNFIDTHVSQVNDDGQPIGYFEAPLPAEWLDARPMMVNGQEIRCAHPALVAYHKLHAFSQGRQYDQTDCVRIAALDTFTAADLDALGRVLDQEQANRYRDATDFVKRMSALVKPDMTLRDLEIEFLSDPEVEPRLGINLSAAEIKGLAKVMSDALTSGLAEAERVTLRAILSKVDSTERDGLEKMRAAFERTHQEKE